jgi:cell division ATPase MinD
MSRAIGIVSGKGGVGKTTLAINLSAALSYYFRRYTTLIDCNLTTSHIGLYLGLYHYEKTLNHVMRGEAALDDVIYQHNSGIKVVPASLSLKDLEGIDITKLRAVIESLMVKNDIIILDGGPGLGREAMATFRASDEILYVASPYIPSVIDVVRCHEVAQELGVKSLGIVLNMVNKDKHEMTKQEIEHLTDLPVISSIPYDREIKNSLANKTTLVNTKPNSRTSKEFMKLASHILGEPIEEKKSVFDSLRSVRFW